MSVNSSPEHCFETQEARCGALDPASSAQAQLRFAMVVGSTISAVCEDAPARRLISAPTS